jgi:hypothetical protein
MSADTPRINRKNEEKQKCLRYASSPFRSSLVALSIHSLSILLRMSIALARDSHSASWTVGENTQTTTTMDAADMDEVLQALRTTRSSGASVEEFEGALAAAQARWDQLKKEKTALVASGVARMNEVQTLTAKLRDAERRLRDGGFDVSAQSTPRTGSAVNLTRNGSISRGERETAEAGAQTELPAEQQETIAWFRAGAPPAGGGGGGGGGMTSSIGSVDDMRTSSAPFNREQATTASLRGSRGGTPLASRVRASAAASLVHDYAALGDSVSQVAGNSGRASPMVHRSFRNDAESTTYAHGRPARPHARRAAPPAPSPQDTRRSRPTSATGKPSPRDELEVRARLFLEEHGSQLAVGAACVFTAYIVMRLLRS